MNERGKTEFGKILDHFSSSFRLESSLYGEAFCCERALSSNVNGSRHTFGADAEISWKRLYRRCARDFCQKYPTVKEIPIFRSCFHFLKLFCCTLHRLKSLTFTDISQPSSTSTVQLQIRIPTNWNKFHAVSARHLSIASVHGHCGICRVVYLIGCNRYCQAEQRKQKRGVSNPTTEKPGRLTWTDLKVTLICHHYRFVRMTFFFVFIDVAICFLV